MSSRIVLFLSLTLLVGCRPTVQTSDEELLTRAKTALRSTEPAKAIPALEELLQRNPRHAEALLFRAQLAREAGDDQAALDYVSRIQRDAGRVSGTARYLEGSLRLKRGELQAAETAFRDSIQLHPSYIPARTALIELLFLQLRGVEAREQLLALKTLQPWGLAQYVQYHVADTELARPEGSRALLQKCLERDPNDVTSLIALIRDDLTAGEPAIALKRLQSTPLSQTDASVICGLKLEALVREGQLEAARQLAPTCDPRQTPSLWLWRGQALLADAQSDWDTAAACWWQVVQSTPNDRQAHYRLAVALERSGKAADADAHFRYTRQLELCLNHVSHILAGDTKQVHLVARMAAKIVELSIELQRLEDAQLWLEYLAQAAPDYPTGWQLTQRLNASRAKAPVQQLAPKFGQHLLAALRTSATRSASTKEPASIASAVQDVTEIRLEDDGAAAGLHFQHFNGPSEFKYLLESLGGAVAVLDFDRDGWPDFYFPQGCRLPYAAADNTYLDQLYRNLGDGTFANVTAESAIVENRYSQGVAAADFDNDGFTDIFVANYGQNSFFRNMGDGTFAEASSPFASEPRHWSSSAAWGDLNRDGLLDLYVVNYVLDAEKTCRTPSGQRAACSPGNFDGEPDLVYLNVGDGSFRQLNLSAAGLEAPDGKGLGIVILDLDDDGWPEIYVANDGTPNFLFRHTGRVEQGVPRFQESGFVSGAALSGDGRSQAGMGIAVADFSGSQRFDLYVTNFYNDYNTLYRNLGDCQFEDATARANLIIPTMTRLGFGTQAVDFNRDGWPDLLVANGHIDDFSSTGVPWKMPLQVFQNRRGQEWREVSQEAGSAFQELGLGRAVAAVDWNRDARPDAAVVYQDRSMALLTNRSPNTGRFLVIQLIGDATNREAIGARVMLEAGGRIHLRELAGGDGYFATNDRRLVIGLGTADKVDRLRIRWSDGTIQNCDNLPVDSSWVVRQHQPPLADALPVPSRR